MKRARVKAARKSPACGGDGYIICAGEAGNGIQKYYYVFSGFNQALGPLKSKFGDFGMIFRKLVKGGIQNIAVYRALAYP